MPLQKLVNAIRQFRRLHKLVGISVILFMIVTAATGILLGWKKHVDLLQPPSQRGSSLLYENWVSFDVIARNSLLAIDSVVGKKMEIDRMDVRPDKGVVKVLFKDDYWEAQVDANTGKVLSMAQRHSDWIEHIHDGSIVSDGFKLLYTNYLGLGLLLLSISGFLLWYGPRVIRKSKQV